MLQGKAIPALSKEEGNKKPVPESEQILTDATFFGPGKPGMVSFNEVNICRSNGPKRDLCLNFFSGPKRRLRRKKSFFAPSYGQFFFYGEHVLKKKISRTQIFLMLEEISM